MAKNKTTNGKTVETFTHDEASRKNIPTAVLFSMCVNMQKERSRVLDQSRRDGRQ